MHSTVKRYFDLT